MGATPSSRLAGWGTLHGAVVLLGGGTFTLAKDCTYVHVNDIGMEMTMNNQIWMHWTKLVCMGYERSGIKFASTVDEVLLRCYLTSTQSCSLTNTHTHTHTHTHTEVYYIY